eukprot:g9452.t1
MCHYLPMHEVLQHSEGLIFKLMSSNCSAAEFADWLRAPLEQACRAGNPDLVDPLLEAGADATACGFGDDGGTLLHAAASGGSERVLSSLLNSGAMENINAEDSKGRTPLQVAVRAGRHAAAMVLISAGANLNSTMTEAILEGHEKLAHDLLLAGSDVNQAEMCYYRGTPLTFASARGYEQLVRELLNKGADTSLTVIGSTALHLAARGGHLSTVEVLLAAGMAVDPFDSNGQTALHIAAKCTTNNAAALINTLVAAGADVGARHPTLQKGGSPLHAAADAENCEAALALLQRHGADPNAADLSGGRPLHDACKRMHLEMVELLLGWGADETVVDNRGNTAADSLPSEQEIHDWYGNPGSGSGSGSGSEDEEEHDDEIEREMAKDIAKRNRLLAVLARAPRDRAWRRRGTVVLCRALPERVKQLGGSGADGYASSCNTRVSWCGGKLARPKNVGAGGDTAGGGGAAVVVGAASPRGLGCAEDNGAAPVHCFDGVAAWLMDLREDGLFRHIVRFL